MDGLDRYERMAQRTRERAARRRVEERAELMRRAVSSSGYAPDQIDGESDVLLDYYEHSGHRTHINFLHHGNAVVCSCGSHLGHFSFIMPSDGDIDKMKRADPGYCVICRTRGVES